MNESSFEVRKMHKCSATLLSPALVGQYFERTKSGVCVYKSPREGVLLVRKEVYELRECGDPWVDFLGGTGREGNESKYEKDEEREEMEMSLSFMAPHVHALD